MISLPLIAALSSLVVACTAPPALPSPALASDSTGAVVDLQQEGSDLSIQAVYVNADGRSGTLTYRLDVTRGGRSRSTNRQSGRFTTALGQTDTLSTTRVSVRPGDEVSIHLTVSDNSGIIDEVRLSPDVS